MDPQKVLIIDAIKGAGYVPDEASKQYLEQGLMTENPTYEGMMYQWKEGSLMCLTTDRLCEIYNEVKNQ